MLRSTRRFLAFACLRITRRVAELLTRLERVESLDLLVGDAPEFVADALQEVLVVRHEEQAAAEVLDRRDKRVDATPDDTS